MRRLRRGGRSRRQWLAGEERFDGPEEMAALFEQRPQPRSAPACCAAEVTTRVSLGGTVMRLTTHAPECPVWAVG